MRLALIISKKRNRTEPFSDTQTVPVREDRIHGFGFGREAQNPGKGLYAGRDLLSAVS